MMTLRPIFILSLAALALFSVAGECGQATLSIVALHSLNKLLGLVHAYTSQMHGVDFRIFACMQHESSFCSDLLLLINLSRK